MNLKISQLAPRNTLTGEEEIPVNLGGANFKIRTRDLLGTMIIKNIDPSGEAYTVSSSDKNALLRFLTDHDGQYTAMVVLPFDDGTINIGTCILISNSGHGQVRITGAVDDNTEDEVTEVTVNTPLSNLISVFHGKVTAIKVGINEWDLEGHLEPEQPLA